MKKHSYNVRDEEDNADHQEMTEKCLDLNGEEKKPTAVDGEAKTGGSRMQELSDRAKKLRSNKLTLIVILLCVLLLVFFIIIIALAVKIGWLNRQKEPVRCNSADCLAASSRILDNWNQTVDPCQDFWNYSCGKWISKHPLPSNRGSVSVSDTVRSKVHNHLRHLLDLVPHDASVRDPEWKAQRFYHSCMNVEAVEQSETSFKNKVNEYGGWILLNNWSSQRWNRNEVLKNLHVEFGATPYFKVVVEPDDTKPNDNIIKILPAGLGLPGPSYYFKEPNSKYETIYKAYLDDVARELGATVSEAKRFAENIFGYEKRIAEASPPLEAYRDPQSHYKKMTIQQLTSLSPTIPWMELLQQYFPSATIHDVTEVLVFSEDYFQKLSTIISGTDDLGMHNYLMWHFSLVFVPHLSRDYRQIANRFYQALEGVENPSLKKEERWEYCLGVTSQYLGHALGAMYVKHYFVPESATDARKVEEKIIEVFEKYSDHIPWVDDSAIRELILQKVGSLVSLRGYPDFVLNSDALSSYYNELSVQGDFFINLIKGKYFLLKKQEAQLISTQVTAVKQWSIFPQDIKAVYQYYGNHLVVPAGLLQEPLYNPASPLSIRYGSLGVHIGNQLFKALDDKGVLYQKRGILDPWLTGRSATNYHSKSHCLQNEMLTADQFGSANLNLTFGELISDLAAVKFAFKAYRSLEKEDELPGIGKGHDEVFFIAYAQSMCQQTRPEKVQAWSDASTTSPKQRRVLNTLRQMPEFAKAFSCPQGSYMNPGNACAMW